VHVEELAYQEHPRCVAQLLEVVYWVHGVMVPVQGVVPADQVHPIWAPQVLCVGSALQAVSVPVQVVVPVDQLQPVKVAQPAWVVN
jgi:hypothetical protein